MLKYKKVCVVYLLVTLMTLMCYMTMQQTLRLSANIEPWGQGNTIATELASGISVQSFNPATKTDLASFGPFIIIADESGKTVTSTATIGGKIPTLPGGIFTHGEDRLTWQPKDNIREAVVITPYAVGNQKGFVVAGQSLVETERVITTIGRELFFGWLILMGVTSLLFLGNPKKKK